MRNQYDPHIWKQPFKELCRPKMFLSKRTICPNSWITRGKILRKCLNIFWKCSGRTICQIPNPWENVPIFFYFFSKMFWGNNLSQFMNTPWETEYSWLWQTEPPSRRYPLYSKTPKNKTYFAKSQTFSAYLFVTFLEIWLELTQCAFFCEDTFGKGRVERVPSNLVRINLGTSSFCK